MQKRVQILFHSMFGTWIIWLHNEHTTGISFCNLRSVSFIPLLARLATEFGLFDEELRERLFINDGYENSALPDLMHILSYYRTEINNREFDDSVDNKYLKVLLQLRKMGIFKKEDIQRYDLLKRLCQYYCYYFAEMRFRFLVEWDPNRIITLIWKWIFTNS